MFTRITGTCLFISGMLSFASGITFLAKIFSNELGWIAGSQYPTRWIRPYIAAWKPGWCLTIDLIFTILSMLVAGFVLYIWHYMEPDEEFIDSMTTDVESESLKPIKPEKLTVKFEDKPDSEANEVQRMIENDEWL